MLGHLKLLQTAAKFNHAIGNRRFSVVNVRHNGKIANVIQIGHIFSRLFSVTAQFNKPKPRCQEKISPRRVKQIRQNIFLTNCKINATL